MFHNNLNYYLFWFMNTLWVWYIVIQASLLSMFSTARYIAIRNPFSLVRWLAWPKQRGFPFQPRVSLSFQIILDFHHCKLKQNTSKHDQKNIIFEWFCTEIRLYWNPKWALIYLSYIYRMSVILCSCFDSSLTTHTCLKALLLIWCHAMRRKKSGTPVNHYGTSI